MINLNTYSDMTECSPVVDQKLHWNISGYTTQESVAYLFKSSQGNNSGQHNKYDIRTYFI